MFKFNFDPADLDLDGLDLNDSYTSNDSTTKSVYEAKSLGPEKLEPSREVGIDDLVKPSFKCWRVSYGLNDYDSHGI